MAKSLNWKVKLPKGRWMAGYLHSFGTKAQAEDFIARWNHAENTMGRASVTFARVEKTFFEEGSRPYYLLVSRDSTTPGALFALEFGDYDFACVQDEMHEYRYKAHMEGTSRQVFYRVVRCNGDTQAAIDARLAELNGSGKVKDCV